MKDQQSEMLHDIAEVREKATHMFIDYWNTYSAIDAWQFWVILICFFVLPLLVLYVVIDRKKIFLIGFYGFNINVWMNLLDTIGLQLNLWTHAYAIIPFSPTGFSANAALMPVVFMLVYQWTLNHNKNFYLYSLFAAMFFSLILVPLRVSLVNLEFHKGVNYFHVLIAYTGVFLFSKLVTSVFIYMQKANRAKE